MTRTTGFGLAGEASVPGKRSEPGVTIGRARAQPCTERRYREGFEVAEHGDECERRAGEGGDCEQERGSATRAAAPQGAANERCRSERAARCTDRPADRLVPLAEHEPDRDRRDDGDDETRECTSQRTGRGEPDRRAEPDEDPDRVPVPHAARLQMARHRA